MSEHERCHDWLGVLGEYLEGDLPAGLCQELEKHMRECENCRVVVNTTRKTIELYHEEAELVEETISPDVRQRLFKRLNLDDFLTRSE